MEEKKRQSSLVELINGMMELTSYLDKQGCTWTFNTPHSSHMGGCWERLIGVARRILKGMLPLIATEATDSSVN